MIATHLDDRHKAKTMTNVFETEEFTAFEFEGTEFTAHQMAILHKGRLGAVKLVTDIQDRDFWTLVDGKYILWTRQMTDAWKEFEVFGTLDKGQQVLAAYEAQHEKVAA